MVVVPTLLTNRAEIEEQVERLEVHYLANPDGDLRFALLSDWTDAPTETHARRRRAAGGGRRRDRAAEPTARTGAGRRRRASCSSIAGGVWNEGERKWMGWERKRGKLHELNRLLRGATDTTFVAPDGGAVAPAGVRYVITLDADTRLPARRRAAAGRHDGAPAQSPALRSRRSAASSRGTACSSRA